MSPKWICVLDFEGTCWPAAGAKGNKTAASPPREIIEFPSVLLKWTPKKKPMLQFVDEFREFVRPVLCPTLSAFCTALTSITQEQVDQADVFRDVYKRHLLWLQSHIPFDADIFFVTVGHWDLRDILRTELARCGLRMARYYPDGTPISRTTTTGATTGRRDAARWWPCWTTPASN